jgi:hypothetical protein
MNLIAENELISLRNDENLLFIFQSMKFPTNSLKNSFVYSKKVRNFAHLLAEKSFHWV